MQMSSHVTKCMKKKGRMNIAFAAIPIIKRKGKRTEEEASHNPLIPHIGLVPVDRR